MKKYIEIFKKTPFFSGINEDDILTILQCLQARVISKNKDEYILHVGDTTEYMGVVLSGSVLTVKEDVWGNRNVIAMLSPGDFFAEVFAATNGLKLNVSIVANQNCELLLMNVSRLLTSCSNQCEHHNRIIRNLVSVLANKNLMLNNKITHMSKHSTREKLLSYLSSESVRRGSLEFDIPFDRQQLADYLCVERAAMSVELSKLKKDGFLETNKNHFKLLVKQDELIS